jgi:hypothetical protein
MKILLANGDSHTSGGYPGNKKPHNKDYVWAKHLAENWGAKYYNIANHGAGTEEISMSTIICASRLVNDNIKPEEIFVSVLWGIDNRKYQFWNGEFHQSYCNEATWDPTEEVKQYVNYKTQLETGGYDLYKDLYNIYTTAVTLERYGIGYCFMNTKPFKDPSDPKIKNLYDMMLNLYGSRVDDHIGFNKLEDSFEGYLTDKVAPIAMGGREKITPYWGEDGHKIWKEFVNDRMGHQRK